MVGKGKKKNHAERKTENEGGQGGGARNYDPVKRMDFAFFILQFSHAHCGPTIFFTVLEKPSMTQLVRLGGAG